MKGSGETRISRRTVSPGETEALAAELAGRLEPGDAVLIEGELGAGKTTFVRGACRALGVTAPVTSPTFTVGQRYTAPIPVSHVDLFRINGLAGEEPDLLTDYIRPDAIAFVEWPTEEQAIRALAPRIAARVRLTHAGGDQRLVEIEPVAAVSD